MDLRTDLEHATAKIIFAVLWIVFLIWFTMWSLGREQRCVIKQAEVGSGMFCIEARRIQFWFNEFGI